MPVPPPPPAKPLGKRRSRLRPTGRAESDDLTAAARDGIQRQHYVQIMVNKLIMLECPTAVAAAQGGDPRAVLGLLAAGRRASTLRVRIRTWEALERWLWASHGERWPKDWRRVLDYLITRVAEPCGRHTLIGVVYATVFWEKATGWPLTDNPLWEPSIKELLTRVTGRARGGRSSTALTLLPMHLALLEAMVVNVDECYWLRCFSGWKALKAWAVLRHSDHRGMSPQLAERHPDRITYTMTQTKTTGRGKRVETRHATLSTGAYVAEASWMDVWLGLLATGMTHERDYLMAAPTRDLSGCVKRELTYAEAAGWSRNLFSRFGETLGMDPQAASLMAQCFTEHSERAFLPTHGMALGYNEEALKPLGGWDASSTQRYMKAAIARTLQVQDEVGVRLRQGWGQPDRMGEQQLLEMLAKRLTAQGLDAQVAMEQAELNRMSARPREGGGGAAERGPRAEGGLVAIQDSSELREMTGTANAATGSASSGLNPTPLEPQPIPRTTGLLPETEKGYVVSVSRKTGFRRLHYLNACSSVPGIHYMDYEWLGETLPAESAYDDHCRQCWRTRDCRGHTDKRMADADVFDCRADPEESEPENEHSSSSEDGN